MISLNRILTKSKTYLYHIYTIESVICINILYECVQDCVVVGKCSTFFRSADRANQTYAPNQPKHASHVIVWQEIMTERERERDDNKNGTKRGMREMKIHLEN